MRGVLGREGDPGSRCGHFEWRTACHPDRRGRDLHILSKRALHLLVDRIGPQGIPQVAVEGPDTLASHAGAERFAAAPVEIASNTEGARRHAREDPGPRAELS